MSVRETTRPLTGKPVESFDVYIGASRDGAPQATLWANKYRAQPIPLRDPAVVRSLIADLGDVLAHLEGRLPDRRLFELPSPIEEEGERCGFCRECCPVDAVPPERPCGRVHDCTFCEGERG